MFQNATSLENDGEFPGRQPLTAAVDSESGTEKCDRERVQDHILSLEKINAAASEAAAGKF